MEKPYLIPCWFNYLSSSISQLHWAAASISRKTAKKNKCKTTPLPPKALCVTAAPWISPPAPCISIKTAQQMDLGKAPEHELFCSSSQNYLHYNTFTKDTEIAFLVNQILQVKTKDYVLTLTTTQCTAVIPKPIQYPNTAATCDTWNQKIHLATKAIFSLKKIKGWKQKRTKRL